MAQGYLWVEEYRGRYFRIEYFPGREPFEVSVGIGVPGSEDYKESWCGRDEVGATMDRLGRKEPQATSEESKGAAGTG